ncbi:hypothetical protein [Motilibacter aurantiacus]|uniref:hypothetical protein n=1 Tax=Motilibacter aurantiacus TaxID=2714955 RepID=UPI001408BDF0|nr:hypothetical protein [Motilibacter aurantiacus]NHC45389.1 hypothetical protein [Motilibacter aurantiacus]
MSPTRSHRAPRPRRRLVLTGRRPRLLAALLGALVLATGSAVVGGAAIAASAGPAVTLANASVPAGGTVTFSGTGFAADARVAVKIDDGLQLRNPTESDGRWGVTADGALSGVVVIPADTPVGPHWLRFLAANGVSIRADVTVASVSLGLATLHAGGAQSFTGTGFVPGARIAVTIDDGATLANPAEGDGRFVVDGEGKLAGSVTVPPSAAVGSHWLRFLASGGVSIKSAPFGVAAATVPAAPVTAGTAVTLTAVGLPAAARVAVKLDSTTTLSNPAEADGRFVAGADGTLTASVTVPGATTAGTHWLQLLATPGVSVRSADFTVQAAPVPPAVTLGATSVQAGSAIPVSGVGFPAGATVTVKLDDARTLTALTAGADGSFTGTVTIPSDVAVGAHTLRFLAQSPATSVRSADFSVTSAPAPAAVSLGASAVQAGQSISFSGTGFPPSQTLTVKLDDSTTLTTFPIGVDGTVSGSVTIAGTVAAGTHWLRFLAPNPSTSVRSADFTVTGAPTPPAPAPAAASLGAASVQAGSALSFGVTGFPAGQTLTVKIDDGAILSTYPISASGTVDASVTIPADLAAGTHWLRFLAANPSTSVRSADFTVSAPPQPRPSQTSTPAPTASPTAAAVRLSRSTVTAGGDLTFSASRFPAGQTLTVKLDDDAILTTFTVGANGSVDGTVTIPGATKAGAHWLRFLAPNPSTSVRSDNFTVTAAGASPSPTPSSSTPADAGRAAASLKATTLQAGRAMSFSVTGFPAGRTLTVKLDDADILKTFRIGADGSVSGSVTIPAATANGTHWLRFLAPDPATSVKSATFRVTGRAAASGSSGGGSAGSGSSGSGSGSSGSGPTAGGSGSGSGGASGGSTAGGAATGAASSGSDANTGAKATLSGSSVTPGGTISFTGRGFPAGEQLTIKLDDQDILQQFAISASGDVSGTVTVPATTSAGAHWLRFLAPNPPTTLTAGFTVVAAAGSTGSASTPGGAAGGAAAAGGTTSATGASASAGGATVTLGASLATAGGELTFTGSGFPASADVIVTIDDTDTLTTVAADAAGGLAGSVILPLDTPIGNHWLTFAANGLSASLKVDFVTSAAPSPATLVADTLAAAAATGSDDDGELPPWGVLLAAMAGAALVGGAAGGGGIALLLQRRGPAPA